MIVKTIKSHFGGFEYLRINRPGILKKLMDYLGSVVGEEGSDQTELQENGISITILSSGAINEASSAVGRFLYDYQKHKINVGIFVRKIRSTVVPRMPMDEVKVDEIEQLFEQRCGLPAVPLVYIGIA